MGILAAALFVSLFAFGSRALGWDDANGNVSIGLFMSFLFGIIAGYRSRG